MVERFQQRQKHARAGQTVLRPERIFLDNAVDEFPRAAGIRGAEQKRQMVDAQAGNAGIARFAKGYMETDRMVSVKAGTIHMQIALIKIADDIVLPRFAGRSALL